MRFSDCNCCHPCKKKDHDYDFFNREKHYGCYDPCRKKDYCHDPCRKKDYCHDPCKKKEYGCDFFNKKKHNHGSCRCFDLFKVKEEKNHCHCCGRYY